jgi:hypothetical protein
MEPVTTLTTVWTVAKTAGEISKKLYEFGKSLKDRDLRQRIDEILDKVRELKQSASQLEDENRDLRERMRFKTDEYEFRTPFYYHKAKPDQPLCAKCFAGQITAPMDEPGRGCVDGYRRCLVCGELVEVYSDKSGSDRRVRLRRVVPRPGKVW